MLVRSNEFGGCRGVLGSLPWLRWVEDIGGEDGVREKEGVRAKGGFELAGEQ